MDAPYTTAKAHLVQVVATANRCRAVWSEKLGFITVVGAETDLDLVELLSTSLLVQANRAMLGAGRHITAPARRGPARFASRSCWPTQAASVSGWTRRAPWRRPR